MLRQTNSVGAGVTRVIVVAVIRTESAKVAAVIGVVTIERQLFTRANCTKTTITNCTKAVWRAGR